MSLHLYPDDIEATLSVCLYLWMVESVLVSAHAVNTDMPKELDWVVKWDSFA